VYLVFVIVPVFLTIWYSLTDWNGVGKQAFNGIANYIQLVTDPDYWVVFKNNFTLVLIALVVQNPVGLVLAYVVSRTRRGYRAFRSIYFLPVVVAASATALMFSVIFNNQVGPFNYIGKVLGVKFLDINWLSDPKVVLYVVATVQVWQYIGIQFVVFLAAVQSIPGEIYESALLDGASHFRMLFSIVIPLLWEVVQICIIWTVTGCLKAFDHSWLMTWGGPGYASTYLPVYMFRRAFKEFSFSYGSTIAVSILFFSMVFTVLFKKFFSRETTTF
jgi:raffinose/stachyose/melibiose transport system permease protein